jgi:hypothetical protein
MKHARVIGLVMIVALATLAAPRLFAQDDGDPLDGVTVRPGEDIVEGDLQFSSVASDGTASLSVTTSIPVACSIVYGKTPDFGLIAVDQDMAGGAHTDHHPLLSGLEPETTYYYRFQGTDADGVIYISKVMTFTTPAFEAAPTQNLASPDNGAEIVGYSSAFGGAGLDQRWGAGSAFDGSPNSAWSSAGDGDNAWIEVKLAQRSRIRRVEFWTRSMSDGSAQILQFTITTDDGETYGPFDLPDASQAYTFDVDIVAETLRFEVVNSSGGNTGAVEIAVYGDPVE